MVLVARARFQASGGPFSLLTLQTCGGGLRFGALQMISWSALLRAYIRLRWSTAGGARFAAQSQQTRARNDQFE